MSKAVKKIAATRANHRLQLVLCLLMLGALGGTALRALDGNGWRPAAQSDFPGACAGEWPPHC